VCAANIRGQTYPIKVFLSYSHDSAEHKKRVLDFTNRLRRDGIDAALDQYESQPDEGWPLWAEKQIRDADYTLMICSPNYLKRVMKEEQIPVGLGVMWEAHILRQTLYEDGARNRRMIPVLFADGKPEYVPLPLRAFPYFYVDTELGYEALYRLVTSQPGVMKPDLGSVLAMSVAAVGPPSNPLTDHLPPPLISTASTGASLDEKEYLRWVQAKVRSAVPSRSHDVPTWPAIPLAALMRRLPFANRLLYRARNLFLEASIYRYNPLDYEHLPFLTDLELSYRSGFGRRRKVNNLARELRHARKVVVLGDPGSGKSVCLRQLCFDLASQALAKSTRPSTLPVFLEMGTYDTWDDQERRTPRNLLAYIREALWAEIVQDHFTNRAHPASYVADKLEPLLLAGRLTIVFDALDEMPQGSYQERYSQLKEFMNHWQPYGNRFIYSCRTLDYDPSFRVGEVIIQPFDRHRIRTYLHRTVPAHAKAIYDKIKTDSSLEQMVSNPFYLHALSFINEERTDRRDSDEPIVPLARTTLLSQFAEQLLQRETTAKQSQRVAAVGGLEALRRFLADLAFRLKYSRNTGTSVTIEAVEEVLDKHPHAAELIDIAMRGGILGKIGTRQADLQLTRRPARVEFVHHRLQEYFAAIKVAEMIGDGVDVAELVDDIWWQETLIIAIGLLSTPLPFIRALLAPRNSTSEWVKSVGDACNAHIERRTIGAVSESE
jgi:hypothetical protein